MKITFYDSGIGGLTIVKEFIELNKTLIKGRLDFEYFADFSIMPLGDKTKTEILKRTKQIATMVFECSDLLVLACNTASVNTIREMQQNWLPKNHPTKQILSISKPITELLQTNYSQYKECKLIILGTQATIDSCFYQAELQNIDFTNIESIPCPNLCNLIEELIFEQFNTDNKSSDFLDIQIILEILNKFEFELVPSWRLQKISDYLHNLQIQNNSLILLACTHYPIIKTIIKNIYPNCIIIDPSRFIANKVIDYVQRKYLDKQKTS